jgi:hypothetical protein
MIAILNSGYKFGAARPVLVPVKGGGWEPRDMPTHAPVAMAGNSPYLPADTVSRLLRILLMPDLEDQSRKAIGRPSPTRQPLCGPTQLDGPTTFAPTSRV